MLLHRFKFNEGRFCADDEPFEEIVSVVAADDLNMREIAEEINKIKRIMDFIEDYEEIPEKYQEWAEVIDKFSDADYGWNERIRVAIRIALKVLNCDAYVVREKYKDAFIDDNLFKSACVTGETGKVGFSNELYYEIN